MHQIHSNTRPLVDAESKHVTEVQLQQMEYQSPRSDPPEAWNCTKIRGGTEWTIRQILQGVSQPLNGSVVRVIQ